MSMQESLRKHWGKTPPLGVLALCLIYMAFSSRVLIAVVPSVGKIDTSWPHHGVFYQWDFFWQIVCILISASVFVASVAAVMRNCAARSWLSSLLVASITLGYIQGAHYIFLQYQFQSSGSLPIYAVLNIFWDPLSEVGYGWLVVALVLLTHYWFFFRTKNAKRFFSGDSDA